MDIAAATVGFVGLSGQALQGCNYLCKIFSDAKDAPELISDTSKELCNLRSQLEAFRHLLLKIRDTSPASLTAQQDPAIPLQSCQDAIQKLQSFADKDVVRKAWHKFDVARNGDKLRRHKSQLEAAKTSLLAAQASIQIALELQHSDVTREVHRSLQQLQVEHTATAQVVQATRDLTTDVHTLQQDNRLFTRLTTASLDQVLSNSQILLTQSGHSAHDAMVAFNRMEDAFTSLSTDLRKGFDNLPTLWVPMVQEAIEKTLAKHNAPGQAGVFSADQVPIDANARIQKATAYNGGICSFPGRKSSEMPLLRRESSSSMPLVDSCLGPTMSTTCAIDFMQSSRRGPKRQKTRKSVFNVWFGRIEITSSTTEQEVDDGSDYIGPMRLQAGHTSFRLIPSLWFLKIGLLFESGNSGPTISHPMWDNRLRVIRTHSRKSAVVDAINCADYIRFRQLLETREITPFDLIERASHNLEPLLECVVRVFCHGPHLDPPFDCSWQRNLLNIARLLADSGVDCGVGLSLFWIVNHMKHTQNDFSISLFRIIMAKSQSDPFECFCCDLVCSSYPIFKILVIVKQDEWDLSDVRTSRNIGGMVHGNTWLRTNQNLVAGMIYMNRSGMKPQHLSGGQSLTVWPSSDGISLNIVGESFTGWTRDQPSGSRSKLVKKSSARGLCVTHGQDCTGDKSYLLSGTRETTCFEFLEGKGAFGHYMDNGGWERESKSKWKTKIRNCCSKDAATLRHSRQHCIDHYGTYFLQDKLPSLLRADGLPEEDVLRLTDYGLDMEPPRPCPYWATASEINSESEESGAEGEELDRRPGR